MKTPREKAKELVEIMSNQTYSYQPYAGAHYSTDEIGLEAGVKCALIAVDELIEEAREYSDDNHRQDRLIYLDEVRTEIEKLS